MNKNNTDFLTQTSFGAQVLKVNGEPFADLFYLSQVSVDGKPRRGEAMCLCYSLSPISQG